MRIDFFFFWKDESIDYNFEVQFDKFQEGKKWIIFLSILHFN